MDASPEVAEYLTGHTLAALATGRQDGSPQVSMIGYAWDGSHVLVTFRRTSAKRANIARQPKVALLVPDGRRALTVYGDGELLERDPARVEGFEAIMAAFKAPARPREEMVQQLDDEGRVVVRITPTKFDLHA
ncbi:MAG TPA: TIGR03618 family F420-dependent PPOX class oxidoreductase [Acidimicrobiia bacterium]